MKQTQFSELSMKFLGQMKFYQQHEIFFSLNLQDHQESNAEQAVTMLIDITHMPFPKPQIC
jgi:hypothetical protein